MVCHHANTSDERPDESPGSVLTIGYGKDRSSETFVELLLRYGIRYVVDVRSKPYSRFRPEFSQDELKALLRRASLVYVFMGDTLGGLPSDPTCYSEGKVDYDKIRSKDWFNHGLDRLESGWRAGHHLAIVCAELEPERCHRSKLIGEALVPRGVPILHIDESGALITQHAAIDRLDRGQGALFEVGYTSRRTYRPNDAEDAG